MENLEKYLNERGTYTSPKNGKEYKTAKALRAHLSYAGTTDPKAFASRLYNVECKHCDKDVIVSNIKRHEEQCYLNPDNITLCAVCEEPIKNYKTSKGTCSRSCANTHFKRGENNGNWTGNDYRLICWQYHKKECIVCKEDKIVSVHHMNENHNDNRPENLVPLCPTHHQYLHSRYKNEIIDIVEKYVYIFISKEY